MECSFSSFDLFEDIVCFGGPDEGLGLAVVLFDVSEDGLLKVFDAGEHAATELILGEVAEETLDHIEPTAGGRREMEMESLVASGPCQHVGVLVRGVVVYDEV
jgi:hypothetical protein